MNIKKIIGITVVLVFAIMTFTTKNNLKMNNIGTIDLYSLSSISMANAEDSGGGGIVCNCTWLGRCKARGHGANCANFAGNGNCQDYNGNC
jgi:hypothetical protein